MPEGNDPHGVLARGQLHSKELRCAAAALKARQQAMRLPVDPAGAYIVTNPITNQDTVIHVPHAADGPPASESVAARCSSSRAAASPVSAAAPSTSVLARGPPSVASSSPRSVRSVNPPSSVGGRSAARSAAVESRLAALEDTLSVEREGRLAVQAELARLQTLLEKNLDKKGRR